MPSVVSISIYTIVTLTKKIAPMLSYIHQPWINNDASGWAGELAHLSRTKSSKYSMPCHGIFLVYSFSMWQISNDVIKYSMTCHQIFCHITKVFLKINKGLLTLNMGLANKALECNLMWSLKTKENQNMNPWWTNIQNV